MKMDQSRVDFTEADKEAAADAGAVTGKVENDTADFTDADMEAAADAKAVKEQGEPSKELEEPSYIVNFSKEYDYNHQKYSSVDLSGLEDLTTQDSQHIDRVMAKLGHYPRDKWRDTLYTKHVAMRATGLPLEFFDQLSMKDMVGVTARVSYYFLFA